MNNLDNLYEFLFNEYNILDPILPFMGDFKVGDYGVKEPYYNPKKDVMALNSKLDSNGNNKYLKLYERKVLQGIKDNDYYKVKEEAFYPILYSCSDEKGDHRSLSFFNIYTIYNLLDDRKILFDKDYTEPEAINICINHYLELRKKVKNVLNNGTSSEYYSEIKSLFQKIGTNVTNVDLRDFLLLIKDIVYCYRCLLDYVSKPSKITMNDILSCYDKDTFIMIYCRSMVNSLKKTMEKLGDFDTSFILVNQIISSISELDDVNYNPKIKVFNHISKKVEEYSFKDLLKEFNELTRKNKNDFQISRLSSGQIDKFNIAHNSEAFDKYLEVMSENEKNIIKTEFDIISKGEGESAGRSVSFNNATKTSRKVIDNDEIIYRKFIFKNTDYVCQIVGRDKFNGYIGFIYENGLVIFERFYEEDGSPSKDNATYIMNKDNFIDFVQLTKPEIMEYIRENDNPNIIRKYHSKNWAENIQNIIESKEKDVESIMFAHSISDDTIGARS